MRPWTTKVDRASQTSTPPDAEPAVATAVPGSSIPAEELEQLTADIVAALKTVYDPEIPADIYELGLIYKIDVDDDRNVAVEMTLDGARLPGGRRDAGVGGERGGLGAGRRAR